MKRRSFILALALVPTLAIAGPKVYKGKYDNVVMLPLSETLVGFHFFNNGKKEKVLYRDERTQEYFETPYSRKPLSMVSLNMKINRDDKPPTVEIDLSYHY